MLHCAAETCRIAQALPVCRQFPQTDEEEKSRGVSASQKRSDATLALLWVRWVLLRFKSMSTAGKGALEFIRWCILYFYC